VRENPRDMKKTKNLELTLVMLPLLLSLLLLSHCTHLQLSQIAPTLVSSAEKSHADSKASNFDITVISGDILLDIPFALRGGTREEEAVGADKDECWVGVELVGVTTFCT
jgi:hypothetical protein